MQRDRLPPLLRQMLAGREEVNDVGVQLVLWAIVAAMVTYIAIKSERDQEKGGETMASKCEFCSQLIYFKPWEHIRRCSDAKRKREEAKKKLTYEERRLAHRRAEGYES